MLYGLSQPETTPEYDEWLDAQEEKSELLKKASSTLEPIPFADISDYDELDFAIAMITRSLKTMTEISDEYSRLEELFPSKHEPGYE